MTGGQAANIGRSSGFADRYDRYRPAPRAALVDVLTQLARAPRPKLVVDIGSGTGLATRLWTARAEKAVGIEPNGDMRRQAEATDHAEMAAPALNWRSGAACGRIAGRIGRTPHEQARTAWPGASPRQQSHL